MALKKSYELVKVSDLAVGNEIQWSARARKGGKPGTVHTLKPLDGGLVLVGTSIGDRRLAPDDPVILVRWVEA